MPKEKWNSISYLAILDLRGIRSHIQVFAVSSSSSSSIYDKYVESVMF